MKAAIVAVGLLLAFAAPAFAQSKPVLIEDAWVRIYDGATSAYFTILNNSEEPDRLLEVSSPIADKAELMRTRVRSGKFTYQSIASLEITGYDDQRLRPGGIYVRLTGVTRRLAVGDVVPLTLRFERSGHIEVSARVGNQLLGNR